MRVRALDSDGDMRFGHGPADFLRDSAEAIAQVVLTRLKLWRGEWFLDTEEGTPWAGSVLGERTQDQIEPALRLRILETPGVTGIVSFDLAIDPDARAASLAIEIATVYGETKIEGVL